MYRAVFALLWRDGSVIPIAEGERTLRKRLIQYIRNSSLFVRDASGFYSNNNYYCYHLAWPSYDKKPRLLLFSTFVKKNSSHRFSFFFCTFLFPCFFFLPFFFGHLCCERSATPYQYFPFHLFFLFEFTFDEKKIVIHAPLTAIRMEWLATLLLFFPLFFSLLCIAVFFCLMSRLYVWRRPWVTDRAFVVLFFFLSLSLLINYLLFCPLVFLFLFFCFVWALFFLLTFRFTGFPFLQSRLFFMRKRWLYISLSLSPYAFFFRKCCNTPFQDQYSFHALSILYMHINIYGGVAAYIWI